MTPPVIHLRRRCPPSSLSSSSSSSSSSATTTEDEEREWAGLYSFVAFEPWLRHSTLQYASTQKEDVLTNAIREIDTGCPPIDVAAAAYAAWCRLSHCVMSIEEQHTARTCWWILFQEVLVVVAKQPSLGTLRTHIPFGHRAPIDIVLRTCIFSHHRP